MSPWLWNLILLPRPKPPAAFPGPSPGDFPVRDARGGRAAGVPPAGKVGARLRSSLACPGPRGPSGSLTAPHLPPRTRGRPQPLPREELPRGCGGARRSRRGSGPGRGGQRTRRRAPRTPGGAGAPWPVPRRVRGDCLLPGPPQIRATVLRFPPARCCGLRGRGSTRLERAAAGELPAPEPRALLRSSRLGLGG